MLHAPRLLEDDAAIGGKQPLERVEFGGLGQRIIYPWKAPKGDALWEIASFIRYRM
jgi:hypothetical protein